MFLAVTFKLFRVVNFAFLTPGSKYRAPSAFESVPKKKKTSDTKDGIVRYAS